MKKNSACMNKWFSNLSLTLSIKLLIADVVDYRNWSIICEATFKNGDDFWNLQNFWEHSSDIIIDEFRWGEYSCFYYFNEEIMNICAFTICDGNYNLTPLYVISLNGNVINVLLAIRNSMGW